MAVLDLNAKVNAVGEIEQALENARFHAQRIAADHRLKKRTLRLEKLQIAFAHSLAQRIGRGRFFHLGQVAGIEQFAGMVHQGDCLGERIRLAGRMQHAADQRRIELLLRFVSRRDQILRRSAVGQPKPENRLGGEAGIAQKQNGAPRLAVLRQQRLQ